MVFDLRLKKNFKLFLSGPSACGKSTLMLDIIKNINKIAIHPPEIIVYYFKTWQSKFDMLKNEYGDNIPANLITPPIGPPLDASTKAKQEELQSKIMDILNKKKETEAAAIKPAPELSASLQKAIDSLIKTGPNLLSGGGAGGGSSSQQSAASGHSDYFPPYGRGGY